MADEVKSAATTVAALYVYEDGAYAKEARSAAQDRCDKCGTPKAQWATTPCVKSLTQSPRHTITRFHLPIPEADHANA